MANTNLHPKVAAKIYSLTLEEGVSVTMEIYASILTFVQEEMFAGRTAPPLDNKRYYPTLRSIRNHVVRAWKNNVSPLSLKKSSK